MPLKDKYISVLELMNQLNAEIIRAEEERGYFIIEGGVNSESDLNLIKSKVDEVNELKADDIKINVRVKN